MADNKIIIELQSKDSATGEITSSVREMEVSLKNLETTGTKSLNGVAGSSESAIASFGKMVASIGAVTLAIHGIKTAFSFAIKATEEFEQKTINIAATLTNMAAEGQGSFKDMFERNINYAKQMYEALRKEDPYRSSSAEDMMGTYNILVQKGYAARVDEAKYLGIITDKIKMATEGQEFQVQVNQEIRALLDGQANAHSSIAQEMKSRLGPAWADIVEKHKEAGDLLKFMADLFPGIEAATEHTQNTLEAQKTTLMGNLKYIGREGMAGAYEDIVETLKRMNLYLAEHSEKLSHDVAKAWEGIRDIVLALPGAIVKASEAIINFGKDLKAISENPVIMAILGAAAGSRLGVPGAIGGAFLGARSASSRSYQSAQDYLESKEFEGYETSMREQTKSWISPAGQTKLKEKVAEAFDLGTTSGIKSALENFATKYGLSADILTAVAQAESGFKQSAVSPKGALGIMQLMPGTAKSLGVDASDALQNIEGGAKYLKQMLDKFGGDYQKALAAYNWGPNHAALTAAGPLNMASLPSETRSYLGKILGQGKGFGDIDAAEKASGKAAKDAEKEANDMWKAMDRLRKNDLREQEKSTAESAKIDKKLHDENLKDYLSFLNNKKKLDSDAKAWTATALQEIMADEKLSYDERLNAANSFKEVRLANIDEEINKLKEKYGDRLSGDIMESYKKAQVDQVNKQIATATQSVALDWESAWKRAAENVQDALADTLYNLMTQTKSAADIIQNITEGIMKIVSQMAAQSIMNVAKVALESANLAGGSSGGSGFFSSIGNLLGGLFGGGSSSSSGGYTPISQLSGLTSLTPASFHSGGLIYAHGGLNLAPDEIPIIAQTGERVLSRSQNQAYEAGTSINITVQNNTATPVQASGQRLSDKEFMIMLDEANAALMTGGGKMAKVLEQRYSMNPATIRR